MTDPISVLREICLALPETLEKTSHGEACFFVQLTAKSTKQFVAVDDHHHSADHLGFWCPAPPGAQEALIAQHPEHFFRPPYVGHRGWVGMRLDNNPDWDEVAEIVTDAYRCIAKPAQIARLEISD